MKVVPSHYSEIAVNLTLERVDVVCSVETVCASGTNEAIARDASVESLKHGGESRPARPSRARDRNHTGLATTIATPP